MPETKLTRGNFCKDYFSEVPRTEGQKPAVECNLCEEGSKKRFLVPRGLSTDYHSAEKHLVKHDKKYDTWCAEQNKKRRRANPTLNISSQASKPQDHKDIIVWKAEFGISTAALEHPLFLNRIVRGMCPTPPRREKLNELTIEYAKQTRVKMR